MADERAPRRSGSPDANEKLLADYREVTSRALWTHTFHANYVSKKRVLAESDTLEHGSIALGYSYLRRNVVPGPPCSAPPGPEHEGLLRLASL